MHVARFMLFLCLPCIARCALITCVACVACAGSLSLRLGQTICLVSHVCRAIACVSSSCHAMVHTCVDDDWVSADQLVESALRPDQLVVSALASRVCASARPLVLVHSHVPCCVWWCHRVGADQLVESVFRPDQLVGPAFAGLGESALWPDPLLCLFGFLCGCEFWHAHETANVCLCFRSCSCFISDRAVAELILWCVPNGTSQR